MTTAASSPQPTLNQPRNLGVAVLAAAVGWFLVDGAGDFRGQAALFPRLIGVVLLASAAAVGLAVTVGALRRARDGGAASSAGLSSGWRVGATELLHVALVVGYVASLPVVGFRVTTFAYLLVMQQLLGYERWLRGAIIALAFVFFLDWFFFSLLSIRDIDPWLLG